MEITWLAAMLIRELRTLRRELEAYRNEADLWVTTPAIPNSTGTLALHLCGNLQHYIGALLGGTGYVRRRDDEFLTRDVPRTELIASIDATIAVIDATLNGSRPIDLAADFPEAIGGKFRVSTGDFLVHLAAHLAFHLGQADYHRRFVTGSPETARVVGVAELATARPVD